MRERRKKMITKAKYSKLQRALEGSDALNEFDWIPGDIQKKLTVTQLAALCHVMKSRNYEGFKDGIKRRNRFQEISDWISEKLNPKTYAPKLSVGIAAIKSRLA